ncbi:hypothetical protein ACROYT_G018206 [Oculina patagonica]
MLFFKGNNPHSKMGQRLRHSVDMARPCCCTRVTKKGCMTALSFAILVCHVGAKFPCKPDQIHWNTTGGRRPKCLDCPDCPAGSQPSVPCGTSVKNWTDIHCVPCDLGKTFSDKYDKAQCMACTVCSAGKAIIKNCTLSSNSECDDKCKQGYYSVPFIFGCFQCSQCCQDGKDEHPAECTHHEKKCNVRSTPCANVATTNVPTTMLVLKTSASLQTTSHPLPSQSEMTTRSIEEVEKPTSAVLPGYSVKPTLSENDPADSNALKATESAKGGNGNETMETVSVVFGVLGIVCLLGFIVLAIKRQLNNCGYFVRFCNNANSNNEDLERMELQLNRVTSASQERLNPVYATDGCRKIFVRSFASYDGGKPP